MRKKNDVGLRLVKCREQESEEQLYEQELAQCAHEAQHARAAGWPWALVKALSDQWTYTARLATGETIGFAYARMINDNWVRLYGEPGASGDAWYHDAIEGMGVPCPRGVDVAVNAIAWVADAPHGS